MTWVVKLDPAAAISGRTQLDLMSSQLRVSHEGIDWGEAAVQQYSAEGRYGQTSVSYRVPNRTITIPLGIGMGEGTVAEETARRELEQKVGMIQREGGVLVRERAGSGRPMYADVVDATLLVPDVYGEGGGVEPNVVLKLITLPDFYGEEIELDAITGSGEVREVLKKGGNQAVIAGDYPARCRIVLKDGSGQAQKGLLWGLRCSTYSPSANARLAYSANELEAINEAAEEVLAGTFSGKAVKLTSPLVNTWHPMVYLQKSGGIPLEHVGYYRIFARVKGRGGQRVRLEYQTGDSLAEAVNEPATMPSFGEGEGWAIVDLGPLTLMNPPVGSHLWHGSISVETGSTSHPFYVDRIWLQPLDEAGGVLRATAQLTGQMLSSLSTPSSAANDASLGGTAWKSIEGVGTESFSAKAPAGESQVLKTTAYGFSIPTSATIRGVEVRVPAILQNVDQTNAFLYKAGAVVAGTKKVNWPKSNNERGVQIFGGPGDLWGTTLTAADVNSSGFGAGVQVVNVGSARINGQIKVTVYFSLAGGPVQALDAILYANLKAECRTEGAFRESSVTSGSYARVSQTLGDLPRLPVSGLEGRIVELLVKNSRGTVLDEPDSNIDSVTAQVFYRPCYLGRI